MRESEFLDLLRYYFRNAKPSEVKEILADYEAHFEEGKKEGLTEEEISKELGSPKDIYDSYQSEGVVDEKTKTSTLKRQPMPLARQPMQHKRNWAKPGMRSARSFRRLWKAQLS